MNNRKNNNLKMKEIKRMSLNSQKLPMYSMFYSEIN